MRIVFVSRFALGTVNGTYNALWSLACSLVKLGHKGSIVALGHESTEEHVSAARREGIDILRYPHHRWLGFWRDSGRVFQNHIRDFQPDIVHLHYVRVPKYVYISKFLRHEGISYVITLHGGMNPREMKRKYLRKLIYWQLLEQYVHRGAAAMHFISNAEQTNYYRCYGSFKEVDRVVGNAIILPAVRQRWKGSLDTQAPTLGYFGRYDIWTKGLDKAAKMLEALHRRGVKAELHLYGASGDRYERTMRKYKSQHARLPIYDHGFVDGCDKFSAMAGHDFFILYSRFELFPISLIEAMSCGVPAIVSENCDLAPELAGRNAAVVVPMNPGEAAQVVLKLLETPKRIAKIAENGRAFVLQECDPKVQAMEMISFYQRVCQS